MDFEAQESARLILLQVAGAVFAGAGLWLLLKPKPSGSTAKIELFGLKFESSSAGVLVFLIGAAFLAMPLFVPEKAVVPKDDKNAKVVVPTGPDGHSTITPSDPSGQTSVNLPSTPEVQEKEPNDRLQAANQIAIGKAVSGEVRKDNDDWYVVDLPEGTDFANLRVRNIGGGVVGARLVDVRGKSIGDVIVYDREAKNIKAELSGDDRLYVWLWKSNYDSTTTGTYEIDLAPVPD